MDTYITKIEDINDDMMATVKDNAVEEIKSSYSYSSNKLSNIEYAGAYLVYTKEDYKANTYNELYAVYTATITFNDKDLKPATIYLPVKMGSVINRSDGKQELDTSWFSLKDIQMWKTAGRHSMDTATRRLCLMNLYQKL